jgi:hypothetical protein
MGQRQWDELAAMASAASAVKRVFPGEVTVEAEAGRMTLMRKVPSPFGKG